MRATLGLPAASTSTSTARLPRRGSSDARAPGPARTGFTTQVDSSVGVTQADGNSIDIDAESAEARHQRARAAGRRLGGQDPQRDPARRAAHGCQLMSMFGGTRDLRERRSPQQRMRMNVTAENLANAHLHQGRRRSAVPAQGSRAAVGRRRRLRRRAHPRAIGSSSGRRPPAASRSRSVTEDQTPREDGLRPRPPRRRRAGLRADAERRHGHRDGRPDRRVTRL